MNRLRTGALMLFTLFSWAFPIAYGQEESPAPSNVFRVTDPEWIVVYNVKGSGPNDPVFNFRVVLHAKSDGEAVMKATLYVQSKFGVNSTDILEFIEVAPKGVKK